MDPFNKGVQGFDGANLVHKNDVNLNASSSHRRREGDPLRREGAMVVGAIEFFFIGVSVLFPIRLSQAAVVHFLDQLLRQPEPLR